MSNASAGSLVNVERLLDRAVTDSEFYWHDGLRRNEQAREAVRLLFDVARCHPFVASVDCATAAVDALAEFDASLAEEKS